MSHTSRDMRELMKRCARLGWEVSETTQGHFRVKPPGGNVMHFSGAGGDPRAIKNILADLRRAGLEEAESLLRELEERERQEQRELERKEEGKLMSKPTQVANGAPANGHEKPEAPTSIKPKVDDHTLGIIRFGRLVERLGQGVEAVRLEEVARVLELADELGLTLHEVRAAVLDTLPPAPAPTPRR